MILPPLALSILGALLATSSSASALPLNSNGDQAQQPFLPSSSSKTQVDPSSNVFLTPVIREFINSVLEQWDSPGLSVAVVRKDDEEESGWKSETAGYGIAGEDGRLMDGDSLHGIASNSKLFLAYSVGLLINNETLGAKLDWDTKVKDVIPEWKLWDETASNNADFTDLLSHRTGMPRHDSSGQARKGGIREMISTMRYLRPSAEFRSTLQYNNLMYETLSSLPEILLNISYPDYIHDNIFRPLNMSSSTFNVHDAETTRPGQLAEGFVRSGKVDSLGIKGTRRSINPYFLQSGNEIWGGAGGVLTSANDLVSWLAMLLNKGKHPYNNETIIPESVVDHCATGVTVIKGKTDEKFPEVSGKMYGAGQMMFSYQGKNVVEHGGSNLGFKTQVSRLPYDNLALAVLSNDEEYGSFIMEIVKNRLIDEILELPKIDWNARYWAANQKQLNDSIAELVPYPLNPSPPSASFFSPSSHIFSHPTYGTLRPCIAKPTSASQTSPYCSSILSLPVVQPLLNSSLNAQQDPPLTLIARSGGFFATWIRLVHFDGNLFNITLVFTNGGDDGKGVTLLPGWAEGVAEWVDRSGTNPLDTVVGGGVRSGLDGRVEEGHETLVARLGLSKGVAEWIGDEKVAEDGTGSSSRGWAFRGGFWGKEGAAKSLEELGLTGKDAAEVWWGEVKG